MSLVYPACELQFRVAVDNPINKDALKSSRQSAQGIMDISE
jgi:hypothetical protein